MPGKDCKSGLDCKNRKHDAIQSAIKSSFLEWISNPGAIHQKGMQSGFCNPAIAILMMPARRDGENLQMPKAVVSRLTIGYTKIAYMSK